MTPSAQAQNLLSMGICLMNHLTSLWRAVSGLVKGQTLKQMEHPVPTSLKYLKHASSSQYHLRTLGLFASEYPS